MGGHMEYEELVRFATERIPNHITRVSHGQGIRFLQHKLRGQDTEQPSVLLLSGHHRVSLLYRHVAFEMHQHMDFGFSQWNPGGAVEREYGIHKAPALIIQKEVGTPPV